LVASECLITNIIKKSSLARITLNAPDEFDWVPVPCLSFEDQCTEKLLANADRWPDTSIKSRDLIDLAVLRLQNKIPDVAVAKAEAAYPVKSPLQEAVSKFQGSAKHRRKCFAALEIKKTSLIIDGIDLLADGLGMKKTERMPDEMNDSKAS